MDTEEQQPDGQLAAYALGALDLDEVAFVEQVLRESLDQQEQFQQFREVVALLPYAATPVTPPDHVRTALMERIAASTTPAALPKVAAVPAPVRQRAWLMPAMLGVLMAFLVGLGGLTFSLQQRVAALDQTNRDLITTLSQVQQALTDTQTRQEQLAAQLAAGQEQMVQLSSDVAHERSVISFVTAPGVATRSLTGTQHNASARGEMYMYPGNDQAVVFFSGLHTLEPGKTYQLWLTDGQTQVAGGTFLVDETGITQLVVEAPREVNAFSEVFLTVEPDGGSSSPGEVVVLSGSL